MQLVLSNNRVLAHGENFISMGGTVINTETNKVYQNATVAECDGCPSDIGVVGYEYHAGEFVPCAPFGKGIGNIAVYCDDCKTPRDSSKHIGFVCTMSFYMAFVGNVNADMVDAAFGKGNEDIIMGVGEALAMYGWFKGMDKTEHPFTHLRKMQTLNDMNNDIYDETIRSESLCDLILANEYAKSKFVEEHCLYAYVPTEDGGGGEEEVVENIVITLEDLLHPFRYSYSVDGKNSFSVYMYINGVAVGDAINSKTSNTSCAEWSAYGITSPGTYAIKLFADARQGSASITCSFNVFKMKQSYDI